MHWSDGDGVDYRREVPRDPHPRFDEDPDRRYGGTDFLQDGRMAFMPTTAVQSLMETPPNTTPARCADDTQALRELLCDAIDTLDARRRHVFDALASGRHSVRTLAVEMSLSKSMVHKLMRQSRALIIGQIGDNPLVTERVA